MKSKSRSGENDDDEDDNDDDCIIIDGILLKNIKKIYCIIMFLF